jgi:hypothetical protein
MSYTKLGSLVELLYVNSQSGKIAWEETEQESVYQVSFPEYSVRISHESDNYNRGDELFVQIINSDGLVIEEASSEDIGSVLDEAHTKMKNIHDIARRQALGVDEAVDSIVSNLNDLNNPF